jgi:hypothetical protein
VASPRRIRLPLRWVLLGLVLLVAILLRLDAFVAKYGALDHPAWARVATHHAAPLGAFLRPERVHWSRVPTPYVGGDPINYLAFAREMQSFYQPHVREPVFLALTRASLWALDGQDAAVSLASAVGSIAAVLGAYLLGAALLAPWTGLLAAALMAVEYEIVTWAPDGWRDDTFTATVLFATWSLVRLHRAPTSAAAVIAGLLCGVATLTRITALTFVLPAVLWVALTAPPPRRLERIRLAALALLVTSVVVAPYLIGLARATGDPLLPLNYHTTYYRHAEGMPTGEPMSAVEYLRTKLASRPVRTIDTAFEGLVLQPFITKWRELAPWVPGLGEVVRWLALAGLATLVFMPAGRLMLVVLLGSLLPYAFTWNVGDQAWRFTMHAYPFYLTAAAAVITGGLRVAASRVSRGGRVATALAWRVGLVAAIVLAGTGLYRWLPWFVVREAIAAGEPTSLPTGRRDAVFYGPGWSSPHDDGLTVRIAVGDRSEIRLPLPERRDYDVVLRVDPAAPDAGQRLRVYFNDRPVALLRLDWDPERVGAYRFGLPADATHARRNRLLLVAEPPVTAGEAGPRFAWMPPDERIAVRFWYVRVTPD